MQLEIYKNPQPTSYQVTEPLSLIQTTTLYFKRHTNLPDTVIVLIADYTSQLDPTGYDQVKDIHLKFERQVLQCARQFQAIGEAYVKQLVQRGAVGFAHVDNHVTEAYYWSAMRSYIKCMIECSMKFKKYYRRVYNIYLESAKGRRSIVKYLNVQIQQFNITLDSYNNFIPFTKFNKIPLYITNSEVF